VRTERLVNLVPRETLVVGGRTVALSYDDPSREYAALRDSCGAVRRDERGRWVFAGAKAAEALSGIVTNEIETLTPGSGCYAAALTPKGRVVADVRVLRRDDDLFIDVSSRAAAGWNALVRKYINPRTATYADVTAATGCVGVYGPRASAVLARLGVLDAGALNAMLPYHHVGASVAEQSVLVVRSPDFGIPGFDLIVDAPDSTPVFAALQDAGARATGLAAADIARVEAGRPEWGIDMDETTIPQEANLEALHAISYTKGCYTGQEVVARVHFRGHVNRVLRGLIADHPLPPRATIGSADREDVGDVRSSVVSPRLGSIALAMIRREVAAGDEVMVRDAQGEHVARVVTLPF
jgi:folate-binding protein YgfZ